MLLIAIIVFVCGVALIWSGYKLSHTPEFYDEATSWPFLMKFVGSMLMVTAVLLCCFLINPGGGG